PIALIPQVVLGGVIVPATTIATLNAIMYAIPARCGFEGTVVPERMAIASDPASLIDLNSDATSATDFIFDGRFECATAQMASETLTGAWSFASYETRWLPFAVLGGMTFGLLILILILLKRRDPV